ncbi:MAG: Bax inhibitor-1/YccA family protein [Saprospiraceae bacterium]
MFDKFKQKESSNPVMRSVAREATREEQLGTLEAGLERTEERSMTVTGAINKTLMLTGLMLITAAYGFSNPSSLVMWGGFIGGLAMVVLGSYKPKTAKWSAPAYALFEGLFVGAISAMYAYMFDGIIIQAVSLTIGVLLAMLFLYQTGLIKVTAKFRAGIMMATGAVMLVYLASFALSFFGIQLPFLHQGGMIGIGISCVVLAIASLNLLLDFDNFEKGAAQGLPARYEWVFAMGLLVTLVWIYVEILRLLSYLSRD